jgi:hypothetical protein
MGLLDRLSDLLGGGGGSEVDEPFQPDDDPTGGTDGEPASDVAETGPDGTGDAGAAAATDRAAAPDEDVEAMTAADVRREAEEFAAEYPAYDLDFTPASLARVDGLADDLPGAPEDVRAGMAAYVGETLARRYGAEWTRDDGAWVVEVGADEPVVLALRALVADATGGDAAIAEVHARLVDRLGLETDRVSAGGDASDATTPEATGGETDDDGAGDGDEVIDRFAARAAAEAAAEDAHQPAPEEAVDRHRTAAEDLVAGWPSYDLDFSVESLVRLDALVGAEFDHSDGDREYEGDPLAVPEGAKLSIPTDGSVAGFGGYLAELFRRHHDATWTVDGDDLVLLVDGPAGTTAFDPEMVAVACFAGESSFVDAYAHVAADAGLEPPISG